MARWMNILLCIRSNMRQWDFTKRKFLSLKESLQHKKASELLKELFASEKKTPLIRAYQSMEDWLELPNLDFLNQEELSHRFHFHLHEAQLSLQEHSLLHVKTKDLPSAVPFLPIHIFLSSLRSAFNVGSILRTVEAFRLGTVHFSKTTPTPQNPKVQKASMNTFDKVPCLTNSQTETLPRPWIALETATPSTPLSSFFFPSTFTLILGNEEFGIPKELLDQCDFIVEIPLCGSKNSLNVAAAFAIAAATIRSQV